MHKKTDDALRFIVKDCREAVAAFPSNPKAIEYLQTANEAERVLTSRAHLRSVRQRVKGCVFDPLTVERARRRFVRNSDYDKSEHKTACFQVGWYRLYGLV